MYLHLSLSLLFPPSLFISILNGTSFGSYAQAKLLAHGTEDADGAAGSASPNGTGEGASDKILRNILANMFVENARLRLQVNSVIRCALNANGTSEQDEDESL